MSRKLNIALLFLVVLPLLGLAAIGLVTVAFVARVGLERTNDLALQELNQAIGLKTAGEIPSSARTATSTLKNSDHFVQHRPRTKLYPEAVKKYSLEPGAKASEKCLEVVDDPDRLLECIRNANPAGATLKNGETEIQGRELETASLPLFDLSSTAAMQIKDGGNQVDFVTVRFSNRSSRTPVTTKVRFQNLSGPRFLVLHGPSRTEWLLDKSKPKNMTGILLLTREGEPTGRVIGVPEGVPVWRYTLAKNAFKFSLITGIIPKCHKGRGDSIECVNGPRNIHSSRNKDMKTPFQIIDDWAKDTLGQRLSTVSSLSATKNGLVVVPMEIISQATREIIKRELRRAKLLIAERKVKLERRRDYEKLWYAEQYALARTDFTERPPFNPLAIAEKAERIVVASVYETLTKESGKSRNSRLYDSYSEYKARADKDIRPISVRVNADKPIILILTSHSPVKWVLDIPKPELIAAVQIEGLYVSSFSGLPKNIPVRINSFAMGNRSTVHYLHPKKKKTRQALEKFGEEFSYLPLRLISNYRADSIEITGK